MNDLDATSPSSRLNKVPEVTLLFWLIKMMSTTVGETAADFLSFNLDFGLSGTSLVTAWLLVIALFFQFRANRYIAARYWIVVVLISVFGTLITDNLTDKLDVPLAMSTGMFSLALLITFFVWYAREKTLSIKAVDSFSRETFYWIAILLTFAMGTAAGDWFAEGLNLGYANAAILFGASIAVVAAAHIVLKLNAVVCFWIAYILTRPFGASIGDLLSQSVADGGLGLGATETSAIFLLTIIGLIAYLSLAEKRANFSNPDSMEI